MADLGKNSEELNQAFKTILTSMSEVGDTYEGLERKNAKYHEKLQKSLDAQKKKTREANALTQDTLDLLEEIPEVVERDFVRSFNRAGKAFEKQFADKVHKELVAIRKNFETGDGLIDADAIMSLKDKNEVQKRIKEINKSIDSIDSRELGASIRKKWAAAANVKEAVKQTLKTRDGSHMRSAGGMLQEWGDRRVQEGRGMMGQSKWRGGLATASGMATGKLGSVLTGASRFAGPVMAAIQGVSAVNDIVNKGNEVYSGGMNDYRSLAGAQMDGEEFVQNAEHFNEIIRDIGRNLSMGVNSAEWKSMFESMAASGLTVDGVTNRMGDLGSVMESVRLSGLALGVSNEVMGESFTQQSLEIGAGLATMQDGYNQIAHSAKQAGIESNRFLGVIQSATLSMGAYGNFTKAAASQLEKMSRNTGVTQREAEETTSKMTTYFKGMDPKDKLSFANMFGPKSVSKMAEALKKEVAKIETAIASGKLSEDEESKYVARKASIETGLKTQGGARSLALANLMEHQNAIPLVFEQIDNLIQSSNNPKMTREEYMGSVGAFTLPSAIKGYTAELNDVLRRGILGDKSAMDPAVTRINTMMSDFVKGGTETSGQKEEFRKVMQSLSKGTSMSDREADSVKSYFRENLKQRGMGDRPIERFIDYLEKDSKTLGQTFTSLLNTNEEMFNLGKKDLRFSSASDIANKSAERAADETTGMYSVSVKNQKDQIKALISLEKMTDIAKDSVIWEMSSSQLAKGTFGVSLQIRDGIYGMLDHFTKGDTDGIRKGIYELRKALEVNEAIKQAKEDKDKISEYQKLSKEAGDPESAASHNQEWMEAVARSLAFSNKTGYEDELSALQKIREDKGENGFSQHLEGISDGVVKQLNFSRSLSNEGRSNERIKRLREDLLGDIKEVGSKGGSVGKTVDQLLKQNIETLNKADKVVGAEGGLSIMSQYGKPNGAQGNSVVYQNNKNTTNIIEATYENGAAKLKGAQN